MTDWAALYWWRVAAEPRKVMLATSCPVCWHPLPPVAAARGTVAIGDVTWCACPDGGLESKAEIESAHGFRLTEQRTGTTTSRPD